LKSLLFGEIDEILQNLSYSSLIPEAVALSGTQRTFDNAINLGSWIFQWNDETQARSVIPICAIYLTGVGCSHCAVSDPKLFGDVLNSYNNLVIIEYEVKLDTRNGPTLGTYSSAYNFPPAIPTLVYSEGNINGTCETILPSQLTVPKIVSLAAVDAVNPCALAVLTFMLLSIITYDPKDKKNIILGGIAFSLSVFLMYMIYGLVIIRL